MVRPAPRPGAPRTITDDQVEIVVPRVLTEKGRGQDTHWTTWSMAGETGLSPLVHGSAGAGVLYMRFPPEAENIGLFVGALRQVLDHERGSVVVLTAPAPVRNALAGHGGMAGRVPSLGLMRAVKDQFDPGYLMAPGRFPEVI